MRSLFGKLALVALCATALSGVSQSAMALSLNISGDPLSSPPSPTPLYGTQSFENNVVGDPGGTYSSPTAPSLLRDPTYPAGAPGGPAATPWKQEGTVTVSGAAAAGYYVTWFFIGAESGFEVKFDTTGTVTFGSSTITEFNQNSNCCFAGGLYDSTIAFGQTSNAAATTIIPFELSWSDGGPQSVKNSDELTPGIDDPSLIYSYVTPVFDVDTGAFKYWLLTTDETAWFAFALNDSGGSDDNHDDFIGVAFVSDTPPGQTDLVPIPAALPLFGSVLGGGILIGRWRKRRRKACAGPVAA